MFTIVHEPPQSSERQMLVPPPSQTRFELNGSTMMAVPIVPLTALRSVKGPGGVMFSHTPTAGRFEQSPAITTGVPVGTLEKEELWTDLDEIELFDEELLISPYYSSLKNS